MRERLELICYPVFEHHVSETPITLKANSRSFSSAFKFSKLPLILPILTCRTLSLLFIFKYLALDGFTLFGLKYKASKFDFVISLKKFVSEILSD